MKQHRVMRLVGGLAWAILMWAPSVWAGADERANALFEAGMAAYKLERYEDAGNKLYEFMSAAPHDPRNDQTQYCIGRSFMHREYLTRAIEEYGYLVNDFPDSPYTLLGLHDRAQCYLKTRNTDKAVEDMEKVIARPVQIYRGTEDAMKRETYESHRQDVFWLAKHYLDAKEYDKAIAAYRRMPDAIEAFRHVVNVYYDLGEFDKIMALIDGLQGANRHEGFKHLAEFYARHKAINQVRDLLAKLLEEKAPTNATDDLVWHTANSLMYSGPEHWEWAMNRVSSHYPRLARRADYEVAKRHWNEPGYVDVMEMFVLKHGSGQDVDDVLRWWGINLERQGRGEEARRNYTRMGNAGLGHWYIAESWHGAHARTNDLPSAIEAYVALRTAFYSPEWSAMAQWRVGELYRKLNNVDGAAEAFRQVAKRFPALTIEADHHLYTMGWYHKAFMGVERRRYGPEGQLTAGDVLFDAGRFDDAEMEYRTAIAKFAQSEEAAWAAYRTALCYEKRQDPDMAVKVLKSVMRRFPKSRGAGEAHTRLETTYRIADTEVNDETDVFTDIEQERRTKSYLEDPEKMKKH